MIEDIYPGITSLIQILFGAIIGMGITILQNYFEKKILLKDLQNQFKQIIPLYLEDINQLIYTLSSNIQELENNKSYFDDSLKITLNLVKNLPINSFFNFHELTQAFGYDRYKQFYIIFGTFETIYHTQQDIQYLIREISNDYLSSINNTNESFCKIKTKSELENIQRNIPSIIKFIYSYNEIDKNHIPKLIELVRATSLAPDLQKDPDLKRMFDEHDKNLSDIVGTREGLIQELKIMRGSFLKYKNNLQDAFKLLN